PSNRPLTAVQTCTYRVNRYRPVRIEWIGHDRRKLNGNSVMEQSMTFLREPDPTAWHTVLAGIGPVMVRSLSLADWGAFRAFGDRVTRDDMRLRFAGPVKLDANRCRRLLDIDHVREEALAAFDRDGAILGVGRLVHTSADEADFALLVRSDLKRRGV